MNSTISCKKLYKDFGPIRALNDINLEIARGEIFGLLGPNGSGKSTLLKILLGLILPTQGKTTVFNQPPWETAIKNRIGFLPELPQYYPFLNPAETLDFYARFFMIPGGLKKKRIEELLHTVDLHEHKKRRLGTFSKGMLQRIGIAVSLINDPDLLLLDEPTVGLDPLGAVKIRDLLAGLKNKGKTIVLCSHILSEIEYSCDNIGILFKGRLITKGPLAELLKNKDKIQINIKSQHKDYQQQLLRFLEQNKIEAEIDNPRQGLEEFFCSVIKESKIVD